MGIFDRLNEENTKQREEEKQWRQRHDLETPLGEFYCI